MIQFAELGVELKSGIFISVTAFILSTIAGLAGSVPAGMVFLRGLFVAPVFFAVGYGVMVVIKRFVPEIYDFLSNIKISSENTAENVDISMDTSGYTDTEIPGKAGSGFTEFTENDYERLQTVKDTGFDGALKPGDGKLGRHIIVEDQLNSYEPKLMAQAIRTMMSKDKD